MQVKNQMRQFHGGPVINTWCFHWLGPRFNATKNKKKARQSDATDLEI